MAVRPTKTLPIEINNRPAVVILGEVLQVLEICDNEDLFHQDYSLEESIVDRYKRSDNYRFNLDIAVSY